MVCSACSKQKAATTNKRKMTDTLQLSEGGKETIDRAREQRRLGKTSAIWADLVPTSISTLRRFLDRQRIRPDTFEGLCKVVGVNWQDVVEVPIPPNPDLDEAPDVPIFYGRTDELAVLEKWIVKDSCRVVGLFGIGGIGKTALSVKLARSLQNHFEHVIWRSLHKAPPLTDILKDILKESMVFSANYLEAKPPREPSISLLMRYLRQRRCLLVLDGWEALLESGQPVGIYREGYEEYGELLKEFAKCDSKSCLVLTSRDKPREIAIAEGKRRPVRSFPINGLEPAAAAEIFREQDLSDERDWEQLCRCYRGNPLALKIVASAIREVFYSSVSQFLIKSLFLGDFECLLSEQFQRLSKQEKDLLCYLSEAGEPVSLEELQEAEIWSNRSTTELTQTLQSLGRRSLLETVVVANKRLFSLQPMVMKYALKNCSTSH